VVPEGDERDHTGIRPFLRVIPPADTRPDDGEEEDTILDVAGWERYFAAYDEHATRLFRIALLLLHGNRADAEDAVQEAFLAAHQPWSDGRVDDLGAYLRRSVTNRVTSGGRHRSVVDRFTSRRRADDRGSRDVSDQATDHVALQQALGALPTRQRAAVVLRYYEGLSVAETASLLGVTDGTVKSQVSDALHKLRHVLGVHA
jgi:RNA polymerase sigma-70 factor (sigma-E family)